MADLDQVYDLALPNDRLILGVKGSVSEYELSLFRQRSQEAIQAKAKRGELTFTLPAGLSWTADGQIELNPDRRVQQAIRMVFDKLAEFGSVRQVLMGLRDEQVSLPTLESERPRAIQWRRPTYRMVLSIVRSPFYAGAYAFGRRESRTHVVEGRATRTNPCADPHLPGTIPLRAGGVVSTTGYRLAVPRSSGTPPVAPRGTLHPHTQHAAMTGNIGSLPRSSLRPRPRVVERGRKGTDGAGQARGGRRADPVLSIEGDGGAE